MKEEKKIKRGDKEYRKALPKISKETARPSSDLLVQNFLRFTIPQKNKKNKKLVRRIKYQGVKITNSPRQRRQKLDV